jgi:hypothetical protein
VLVVGIDERAVDIEDGGGYDAVAPACTDCFCASCLPSANSSTSFALKAGRSSGLRLVTSPLSTTTCSSIQLPPALRMSVFAGSESAFPIDAAP